MWQEKTAQGKMNNLDKAIKLSTEVHEGQLDLGGNPYILHPLRVLCGVEKTIRNVDHVTDKESILCSAVLHDIIEDCKIDQFQMQELITRNFSKIVYKQINSVTRRPNESWKNYINRAKKYYAPRIIKIADLEDNLDNSRLKEVTDRDIKRNRMYLNTLNELKLING